jgi:lambda family phage portal protein
VQAAILRTLIGFFIRSPYDADAVQDSFDTLRTEDGRDVPGNLFAYDVYREMSREKNPVVMGGVRVPVLAPGEEVQQVQATGTSTDFEAFEHAFLRSIASATGQTAEEVTGDYRKVNYSSARAALLVAWRTLLRRRADFAAGFATPVYAAWLEEAVLAGRLPLPRPVALQEFAIWRAAFARCGWIGPGRGWVDPVKERQGEQIGLEMGTGTLADVCAEVSGRDWREVLEQRAVEREYARSLGLPDFAWNAGMPAAAPVAAETEEEVA